MGTTAVESDTTRADCWLWKVKGLTLLWGGSQKKLFLHIGPTMKNTHKLPGPAEVSHDDRARVADPLPGVKEDQMMGPEVFSAMGFAAGTFSKRMGRGKWCRRCCGLFRCPEVVFVFVSIQTEPRLEVIMLDWLRSSEICRFFYLCSSVDMPLQPS